MPNITGYAQISGDVQLELFLSPPVATPGQVLTANFVLTNHTPTTVMPEVVIPLTEELTLESTILPASTSLNLVTNQLSWQPLLTPDKNQQLISLNFRVGAADLNQPEKLFELGMRLDKQEIQMATATYWVGLPPEATILANPLQPAVGQPVQLLAQVSGSAPFHQVWELGDGRRVEAIDPVVVYPRAGIYTITLQLTNPLQTSTATTTITVLDTVTASFTPDDPTPGVGQPIRFINQSGGESPLSFWWDFGDGQTSNVYEPSHAYTAVGEYRVSLLVQNGKQNSTFVWPLVVGTAPTADLILPEMVPLGQVFTAQAVGEAGLDYLWQMGDGQIVEGEQITYQYQVPGDYYVSLTASNEYASFSIGQWIRVETSWVSRAFLPILAGNGPDRAGTILSIDRSYPPFTPITLEPIELPAEATPPEKLFWYINEARRLHNLPPLTYVHILSVAAQRHIEDMLTNNFAGHIGSDGSRPFERFSRYGYLGGYGGETTAWGFEQPHQAVEFWVNSPDHRRILLNEKVVEVGIGYVYDVTAPNIWYWVAEFGKGE